MKKAVVGIFCGMLALGAGGAFALEPVENPAWAGLDELVTAGLDAKTYPGAVLIVGKPGEIVWAKSYGHYTYDENSKPLPMDAIFDLASVTKVMGTASASLLLLEDGKIALDEPVSKYIPGFEQNGKDQVTLLNLMTHTSGLKAYESVPKVQEARLEGESTSDALIRDYAELPLKYPTGTDSVYSCLNMQTMARVNETAANERLEDFLTQRIYGPLGMKDTVYNLSEEQLSRTVPTILNADGTKLVGIVHDPLASYHGSTEHCPGNAGLFSTAPDAAKYMEMVMNGGELNGHRIYKSETLAEATRNRMPDGVKEVRGLGWDIYENPPYVSAKNDDEHPIIAHTGYTGTFIWGDELSKTYIVFFTNRVYPDDAKNDTLSITDARKSICRFVLAQLPQHHDPV